eukprot:1569985-Amphidinium_carterae.1
MNIGILTMIDMLVADLDKEMQTANSMSQVCALTQTARGFFTLDVNWRSSVPVPLASRCQLACALARCRRILETILTRFLALARPLLWAIS